MEIIIYACTKMSDNFLLDGRYSNFFLPSGSGGGGGEAGVQSSSGEGGTIFKSN